MLAAARTSQKVLYCRLHRLGVDAESLRLLNPTKGQLGQLLGRFQKLHDRRLVRFISSLIMDTAQDLSIAG